MTSLRSLPNEAAFAFSHSFWQVCLPIFESQEFLLVQ